MQTISGFVSNEKDNKPISQAKVSLFANNELIDSKLTQSDAEYMFNIKCDTNYKIITEKETDTKNKRSMLDENNIL